jgi:hypothetical protein
MTSPSRQTRCPRFSIYVHRLPEQYGVTYRPYYRCLISEASVEALEGDGLR